MKPHITALVLLLFANITYSAEKRNAIDTNSTKDSAANHIPNQNALRPVGQATGSKEQKASDSAKPPNDTSKTDSGSDWDEYMLYVTLLLFGIGVWQVLESRWSHQRELRAYVHIANSTERPIVDGVFCRIHVKNFGQTPARNVRRILHIKLTDPKVKFVPDFSGEFTNNSDLAPSDWLTMDAINQNTFTPEMWGDIAEGKVMLRIWGIVKYQDVFKKTWRTRFNLYMDVGSRSKTALTVSFFVAKAEDYNDAT